MNSGRKPGVTDPSNNASQSLHVLVAEDSDFSARLLERLLSRRGHRIRLATTGREALDLADQGGFDVLLLDLQLPDLDGFEVVRAIRERERVSGAHLPIVALTADIRGEDRERCLAAGMDDFLSKPVRADHLWETIERTAAAPLPVMSDSGPGLIDARVLLAVSGDNEANLQEICRCLQTDLPDYMSAVEDALRGGDAPRLRASAHRLCGMISAFSTKAGAVASEIEDRATRLELAELPALVQQLGLMSRELLQDVNSISIESLRREAARIHGDGEL